MVKYKIIKTQSDLDKVINYCIQTGKVAIDFETSSLEYFSDTEYPTILGIAFQHGFSYILPLGHYDSPFKDKWQKIIKKFGKAVIENPFITKVAWNLKYEYKWFLRCGIQMKGNLQDGMLAKFLLNEERPHDLKTIVGRYYPQDIGYDISTGKNFNWASVGLSVLSKYCAIDVNRTLSITDYLVNRLIDMNFYRLYRNMLMMSSRVLAKSEFNGILIDTPYLKSLVVKYQTLIEENKKALFEIPVIKRVERDIINQRKKKYIAELNEEIDSGELSDAQVATREQKIRMITLGKPSTKKELKIFEPINFSSPEQMRHILYYSKKGYRFKIINKTESGEPATDEETIKEYLSKDKYGFITALLKHRELEKLSSTYITGIESRVDKNNYLHASYLIHGTVTGRFSSSDPNMQNVPRPTTNPDIKKMFVPPKGYLIVECDYSQAELRIAAELAKEQSMIDMFNNEHDIHLATTAKTQGVTYEHLYNIYNNESHKDHIKIVKERKKSKKVNFGILYEQSAYKLSHELTIQSGEDVSIEKAQQYLDEWFETFPKVKKWIDKQHSLVKKQGFIINIFGFKRRLPKINSSKYGEKLEAQRQSVNAPIQGAASYYTAFAGILIEELRLAGKVPLDFPQIYTVHDSLGFYVKRDKIHEFYKTVIPLMSNPDTQTYFGFKLKNVKMKADMEVGTNWANIREYHADINYDNYDPDR